MAPKQNILDYRSEKYGIDELTGESALSPRIKADLHNSVDVLAKQLYSKHFTFLVLKTL